MSVYLRRCTVYLMHASICYLIGRILSVLGIIQLLNYDLIPWLNTTSMFYMAIIVFIILLAWSGKDEYLTQTYSYLKHNRGLTLTLFYIIETITYAKVIDKYNLVLGYSIVFFFYWYLLHCKRQVLFPKKRHLFFPKCGKLFSRVCGILFSRIYVVLY